MTVGAKLQLKAGHVVAILGAPADVEIDLNRDLLASLVCRHGPRPIRQIAIDDVWSALRFRPARPD